MYDSCVRFHEKKNYRARQIEVKPHPFRSSYVFIHEFALMIVRGTSSSLQPHVSNLCNLAPSGGLVTRRKAQLTQSLHYPTRLFTSVLSNSWHLLIALKFVSITQYQPHIQDGAPTTPPPVNRNPA